MPEGIEQKDNQEHNVPLPDVSALIALIPPFPSNVNEAEFDEQITVLLNRLREIYVTQGMLAFLAALSVVASEIGFSMEDFTRDMERLQAGRRVMDRNDS